MTKTIPISHYLSGNYRKGPAEPDLALSETFSKEREAERKAWFEQGFEAGRTDAIKDNEIALEREIAKLGEMVMAARSAWTDTESVKLAQLITQALDDLERRIANRVAYVLKPFVREHVLHQAINEICQSIAQIATNPKNVQLKIAGPEDLVAEIRRHTPETIPVTVESSHFQYVKVETGETVIETNIDEWFQRLEDLSRA